MRYTVIFHLLTLSMLNCFQGYKRYIYILFHILDFFQQKKNQFIMEQPYMLPILYCQYYACLCPGDLRSQGISRHVIGLQSWTIPSPASVELIKNCQYDATMWHWQPLITQWVSDCWRLVWQPFCLSLPDMIQKVPMVGCSVSSQPTPKGSQC